jgi:hypothetical protein
MNTMPTPTHSINIEPTPTILANAMPTPTSSINNDANNSPDANITDANNSPGRRSSRQSNEFSDPNVPHSSEDQANEDELDFVPGP